MDIRTALKLTKGDVFAAAILAEGWRGRYDERAQELFDMKEDDLPKKAKVFIGKKQDSYQQQAPDAQKLEWFKEYAEMEANSPQKGARPQKRARLEEDTLPDDAKQILELNRLLTAYVSENPGDYYFSLKKGVDWVNSDAGWVQLNDREGRTGLEVQHGDVVVVFKPEDSSAASGSAADEDMREPSVVTFDDDDARNVVPSEDELSDEEDEILTEALGEFAANVDDTYYYKRGKDNYWVLENEIIEKYVTKGNWDKNAKKLIYSQRNGFEEAVGEEQSAEQGELEAREERHFKSEDKSPDKGLFDGDFSEVSSDEGSSDVSSLVNDEEVTDNPVDFADPTVDEIEDMIVFIISELDDLADFAFYAYQDSWNRASLDGAPAPLVEYVKGVDYTSFAEGWGVDERVLSRALKFFWSQDDAVETFLSIKESDDLKLWQIEQDHKAIMDQDNKPDPLVKILVNQLERELGKLDDIHTNEAYPSKKWFKNWERFKNFRKQTGKKGSEELDERTRVRVAQAFLYEKIEGFDQYGVALNDISVDYFLQQFKGEKEIKEELQRLQANWSEQEEPYFFEYFAGLYQKLGINSFDPKYLLISSDAVKKQEKNFELFLYIYDAIDQKLSIPRELDEEEEARLEELERELQEVKDALGPVFNGPKASRRVRKLEDDRTSIERSIDMLRYVNPADRMARLRAFRDSEKFERRLEKATWQSFFYRRSILAPGSNDPEKIGIIEERLLQDFDDVFPDLVFARDVQPEERDFYKGAPRDWGNDELKRLYDEWIDALTPPKVPPELQNLLKSLHGPIGGVFFDKSVYYETPEDYSDFYPEKMSFAYWENTLKVGLEDWIEEKRMERVEVYNKFTKGELKSRPNFDNIGPQKIRSYDSEIFKSLLERPSRETSFGQGQFATYNDVLYLRKDATQTAQQRRHSQIRKWAERFCFGYRFIDNKKGFIDHGEKRNGRDIKYEEKGWWNTNNREMVRYLPLQWSSDGGKLISEAWVKGIIEAMVLKLNSKFM